MRGKTVVITGATSGIGAVAARCLAEQGARLIIVARDEERAGRTLRALHAANPAAAHGAYFGDLSRLDDMKRVAAGIAAAEPRIDVLMNNAGTLLARNRRTEDGLEVMFATNHMSYFVMTNMLLERLRAAGGAARIVSTASAAHRRGRLDFGHLQDQKGASGYGTTKLCNILFTRELARHRHRYRQAALRALTRGGRKNHGLPRELARGRGAQRRLLQPLCPGGAFRRGAKR